MVFVTLARGKGASEMLCEKPAQIPGAEGIPCLALENREETRAAVASCLERLVFRCNSTV